MVQTSFYRYEPFSDTSDLGTTFQEEVVKAVILEEKKEIRDMCLTVIGFLVGFGFVSTSLLKK